MSGHVNKPVRGALNYFLNSHQSQINLLTYYVREESKVTNCHSFIFSLPKLSVLWEEKLKEELKKTKPLEEVCAALREELDAAHRQRIEAFEVKMKPIIIRDGPSRKVGVSFISSFIKGRGCQPKPRKDL